MSFKSYFEKEFVPQNEGFENWSLTGVKSMFKEVLKYIENHWNIKGIRNKNDIIKVDVESNITSGELSELEDLFPDFVFSADRKNHIITIEKD
jgi:hypothetical protein